MVAQPLVELCWCGESVADVVSDVLSSFVGEKGQKVESEVVAEGFFDCRFPEDVVEVFQLHQPVSARFERGDASEDEEFAECLFDLGDDDVDCFGIHTGVSAFL